MVVTTCGSCNTLVSLDEGIKKRSGDVRTVCCDEERVFSRSDLLLPEDDFLGDDDWCLPTTQVEQHIYLPTDERDAVDMCLKSNPQIMETCDELLANAPRYFDSKSPERVLYVAQGEVAHAVSSQCDIIVSDKATTCHILALRSTCGSNSVHLTSLTHVDGVDYEDCIRNMVQEHKLFHGQSMVCGNCGNGEEKKEEVPAYYEPIEMDIHLVGGFEDMNGTSRETSNFLIHLLARIASEERNLLRMTLKTCAISSMNDNGYSCPIGRGMGIDLRTGKAFLAKVDSSAAGPFCDIRSVRLWMNQGPNKQLSLIHSHHSNKFMVAPFHFQVFNEVHDLLQLNDEHLLSCTSTSPDVEEDDFCDNVRASLKYLRDYKSHDIFGTICTKPLFASRSAESSNTWKTLQC